MENSIKNMHFAMFRKQSIDVFFGAFQGQLPADVQFGRHICPAKEFAQLLRVVSGTWEWFFTRDFTRHHQGLSLRPWASHDFVASNI